MDSASRSRATPTTSSSSAAQGRTRSIWQTARGFSAHGPRYEIRAIVDAAPTVEIREPKANIFVTADATLPIDILAHDDLAIRRIALVYLRSDQSDQGEQSVELVALGDRVSADAAHASAAENYGGDRRELEHAWDLTSLGLPAGTQVTFHASAEDYAGQSGASLPRRLTIVTPEEIQDRLADRQALIFNEFARVLELEDKTRSHVTGLEVQLDEAGTLAKSDVDALQRGLNQQQVERELTSDSDGLRGQIADFLGELKINKIDGPDTGRQMNDILDQFDRLSQDALPTAARELTSATKAAQVDLQDAADEPAKSSAAVWRVDPGSRAAQDEAVGALERILDEMKQWVNYSHFHREIGQLSKAQEEIAADTTKAGGRTLTRSFDDLDPQERADLQKLAQRQFELARRMGRVEQRMEDTEAAARHDDPLVADTMSDALNHARTEGIAEAMRSSGQNVEQNRIGQVHDRQQEVARDLRELLDILSNRREHELGRLVKKLREAEEKLAKLAAQQQGLQKKLAAAQDMSEPERRRELERLSRQERALSEEAERLARSLERLQAEKASASAAKAGGEMGGRPISPQLAMPHRLPKRPPTRSATWKRRNSNWPNRASKRKPISRMNKWSRMEDAIASMQKRQQNVIQETTHYRGLETERGQLTRAESLSVRDVARAVGLARRVAGIGQDARRGRSLQVRARLRRAGHGAGRRASGTPRRGGRDGESRVPRLARIEQLIAALKQDAAPPPDKPPGEEGGGGEGAGQGGGGQQPNVRSVAELKLLKLIQEQINARTLTLDEARRDAANLSDEQQLEFAQLSEEQGRLADLIANMMQVTDEKPEDNPAGLPDIREKTPAATPPGAGEEDNP